MPATASGSNETNTWPGSARLRSVSTRWPTSTTSTFAVPARQGGLRVPRKSTLAKLFLLLAVLRGVSLPAQVGSHVALARWAGGPVEQSIISDCAPLRDDKTTLMRRIAMAAQVLANPQSQLSLQFNNDIISTKDPCPSLPVNMLGPLRARDADGNDRLPRARKTRAVLAILTLAAPRPVARSQLIALLWSAARPSRRGFPCARRLTNYARPLTRLAAYCGLRLLFSR